MKLWNTEFTGALASISAALVDVYPDTGAMKGTLNEFARSLQDIEGEKEKARIATVKRSFDEMSESLEKLMVKDEKWQK